MAHDVQDRGSVETGLRAAQKLQSFLDSRDKGVDPEAILARAEGRRADSRTIEAPSDAVREFSPKPMTDEDDF